MTTALDLRPTPTRMALPPAGPAWFSSVMGTGILALLTQLHLGGTPIGRVLAIGWLVIGWSLLLGLAAGFAWHCMRHELALRMSITDPVAATAWGTVAMGILSIGSATLKVVGGRAGLTVDVALWTVGTPLGFVTAIGFTTLLMRHDCGRPALTWGLPIVPPMVAATAGATVAPLLDGPWRELVWLVSGTGFLVAAALALAVFGTAYRHHLRVAPVPTAASATSWIPLGVVGQSMAAAVALYTAAAPVLRPRAQQDLEMLTHFYGYAMLLLAVPVIGFALATTGRGFRARMAFAPNWWSLTFPVGTLSLGAHLLGAQAGFAAITAIGWIALVVLMGTWTLCATASVRAVAQSRWAR